MRNPSKTVAGAAGLMVLFGVFAITPVDSYATSGRAAHPSQDAEVSAGWAPDLGSCQNLEVPEGHQLAFKTYADGVQIYRWDGTTWVFQAPEATLYADAGMHGEVGIHYAGPTWESNSGSKVVGRVLQRCTADANSIPWLLLEAIHSEGPGIFARVTYIQRVNTAGGKAPARSGAFDGEVVRVPYTTEYYFYRAGN